MTSAGKHAVFALLAISIAGCGEKKVKTAPPVQAQAPSVDAGKAGAMYPPPLTSTQPQTEQPPAAPPPTVATAPPPTEPPAPAKTKKSPTAHKTTKPTAKPDGTDSSAAPPLASDANGSGTGSSNVAANGEPAASTPIGQLTTGDVAGQSSSTRKDTVDLINSTENGLNNIKRSLSSQEQETVSQIRTFLTKAKQALSGDDLEGAHTLATKAKVLLDELNKS